MAKRTRSDNGSSSNLLYYHTYSEKVECHCGKIIDRPHECTKEVQDGKLHFVECDYKRGDGNCIHCEEEVKRREYSDQWTEDQDNYNVCSECYMKCENGQLPKGCECEFDEQWETDSNGDCACSDCHVKCEYGVIPKNCRCEEDSSEEESLIDFTE